MSSINARPVNIMLGETASLVEIAPIDALTQIVPLLLKNGGVLIRIKLVNITSDGLKESVKKSVRKNVTT